MSVSIEKLNKRDFELLGHVFDYETRNLLPAQIGKSKAVASLHERGYIQPMTEILPGPFSIRIEGWELTHAGRLTYCANCSDENATR